jgi:hypothetical protein
MRLLLAVLAAALALGAAPALAQDEEPTPAPTPGCERGPGTDADYADCPTEPCAVEGPDADYAYCAEAIPARGIVPKSAPRAPEVAPVAFPAQLPRTGGEPLPLALIGLAFLMCGAGLRLCLPPPAGQP